MKQLKTRIICILFFLVMPTFGAFSQTEDFFTFIKQFCLDSTFQQMRTINPLEVITWDYENDEKKIVFVEKKQSIQHGVPQIQRGLFRWLSFHQPRCPIKCK